MRGQLVILFCAIITIHSIPTTNIGPCREEDNVCLTKMANIMYTQAVLGDPTLNIKSLEPFYREKLEANLATIKYKVMNTTSSGLGSCVITNTTLCLEKSKWDIELICPYFNFSGDYEIDGQILGELIQGKGVLNIEANDYYVVINTDIKVTQDGDGKMYMAIKTFKVTADCRGGIHFDLTNLFNGNKELGDSILKFMNENGKVVANQIQGPLFSENLKPMIKNFNKWLKSRPLDKLIL